MYIVEGNIGVGKSTFLKFAKQYFPEMQVLTEPVDNWANQIYGQSLLECFYKDPKRWSYTIETLTMMCRARDHIREQKKNNRVLLERSIYSGHYCFALNGYQNGCFTQVEWQIYNKWIDFLLHRKCKPPYGFIYLKADPTICFDRVKKRNRISEKKMTLAYLRQIDYWHERFLVQKEGIADNLKSVSVLVLDCNDDFVENEENMHKHIVKLQAFFAKQKRDNQEVEKTL